MPSDQAIRISAWLESLPPEDGEFVIAQIKALCDMYIMSGCRQQGRSGNYLWSYWRFRNFFMPNNVKTATAPFYMEALGTFGGVS